MPLTKIIVRDEITRGTTLIDFKVHLNDWIKLVATDPFI